MQTVVGGHLHELPDGEEADHVTSDGPWCPCSPRERSVPLAVADRAGYASVVLHASRAERASRSGRLA